MCPLKAPGGRPPDCNVLYGTEWIPPKEELDWEVHGMLMMGEEKGAVEDHCQWEEGQSRREGGR